MFPSSLLQVIYALNTKNDEHEAAIATLKEAHEEEVQQILSETREKILQVYTAYLIFIVITKKILNHFYILNQSLQSEGKKKYQKLTFSMCICSLNAKRPFNTIDSWFSGCLYGRALICRYLR